jgi:HEPN domain-containing protein
MAFPSFEEWLKFQAVHLSALAPADRLSWEKEYRDARLRAARPPDVSWLQTQYFRAALEHYTAARFSALSGFILTAGVQFHLAIELYLKGLLCRVLDENARRKLSHDFPAAWNHVKRDLFADDPSLVRFDVAVADLHKHWGLRYLDDVVVKGLQATLGFGGRRGVKATSAQSSMPQCDLYVGDLDELVAELWKKSDLNIKAFMTNDTVARERLERFADWVFW